MSELCRVDGGRMRAWLRERRDDLVWCNRVNPWAPVRDDLTAACVVGIDDLQDRLAGQRLNDTGDAVEVETSQRWTRLQEAASRDADWLVACSELDRVRLGFDNCGVVPMSISATQPMSTR